ncbi:hypothetical protein H5410_001697 [Solanum commersonii]|uniref:Uncharacterized protein n=1 Tax=Solanum commersonii TaxID=4109 RepID=A0A9J6AZW1_SOLCO|nr:hypothetical protein H5410_001697 [Solanum commersonii]
MHSVLGYADAQKDCCCQKCDIGKRIQVTCLYKDLSEYYATKEMYEISGGKKYGCLLKKIVSSRVVSTKFMLTVTQGNLSKPRTQILNHFPEKSTIQYSLEYVGYAKPRNEGHHG